MGAINGNGSGGSLAAALASDSLQFLAFRQSCKGGQTDESGYCGVFQGGEALLDAIAAAAGGGVYRLMAIGEGGAPVAIKGLDRLEIAGASKPLPGEARPLNAPEPAQSATQPPPMPWPYQIMTPGQVELQSGFGAFAARREVDALQRQREEERRQSHETIAALRLELATERTRNEDLKRRLDDAREELREMRHSAETERRFAALHERMASSSGGGLARVVEAQMAASNPSQLMAAMATMMQTLRSNEAKAPGSHRDVIELIKDAQALGGSSEVSTLIGALPALIAAWKLPADQAAAQADAAEEPYQLIESNGETFKVTKVAASVPKATPLPAPVQEPQPVVVDAEQLEGWAWIFQLLAGLALEGATPAEAAAQVVTKATEKLGAAFVATARTGLQGVTPESLAGKVVALAPHLGGDAEKVIAFFSGDPGRSWLTEFLGAL